MPELKQNKGAPTETEAGKGGKPDTGNVSPYLLERRCSKPKAHSSVARWGLKDCTGDCLFQHRVLLDIAKLTFNNSVPIYTLTRTV